MVQQSSSLKLSEAQAASVTVDQWNLQEIGSSRFVLPQGKGSSSRFFDWHLIVDEIGEHKGSGEECLSAMSTMTDTYMGRILLKSPWYNNDTELQIEKYNSKLPRTQGSICWNFGKLCEHAQCAPFLAVPFYSAVFLICRLILYSNLVVLLYILYR